MDLLHRPEQLLASEPLPAEKVDPGGARHPHCRVEGTGLQGEKESEERSTHTHTELEEEGLKEPPKQRRGGGNLCLGTKVRVCMQG